MLSKLFWSIAVTMVAVFASFVDGVTDYYILADQSLSLFFSGFGAIIFGLIVTKTTESGGHVLEVNPTRLLISFILLFVFFLAILGIGEFPDPTRPTYWIPGCRTAFGTLSLIVGLWLTEGLVIKRKPAPGA